MLRQNSSPRLREGPGRPRMTRNGQKATLWPAWRVPKVTFGTRKVTFGSPKVTFGTHKVTLRTNKVALRTLAVTFGTDKMAGRTSELTLGTVKTTRRTLPVTLGTLEITFGTRKVVERTSPVTLGTLAVTFGTGKVAGRVNELAAGTGKAPGRTLPGTLATIAVTFGTGTAAGRTSAVTLGGGNVPGRTRLTTLGTLVRRRSGRPQLWRGAGAEVQGQIVPGIANGAASFGSRPRRDARGAVAFVRVSRAVHRIAASVPGWFGARIVRGFVGVTGAGNDGPGENYFPSSGTKGRGVRPGGDDAVADRDRLRFWLAGRRRSGRLRAMLTSSHQGSPGMNRRECGLTTENPR